MRHSLTQLPQQLELLTALRWLNIENFNGVESLLEWLGSYIFRDIEVLTLKRSKVKSN